MNTNYYSSYVNRIIELCIYQKKEVTDIYDLILKENITTGITHRLYFIDEVSSAFYYSLYNNDLKNSIYWSSELFGAGEYDLIIKNILDICLYEIGILYQDLIKFIYSCIYNFKKSNIRKKKELILKLIYLVVNCKKNSMINNLCYLSYKDLIYDDLNININFKNLFSLVEINIVKFVRILLFQNKSDKLWNYLRKRYYSNHKFLYYLSKYNSDFLFMAVLDFYRNNYTYNKFPEFKINNNNLKYFGFNLTRNKSDITKKMLLFKSDRGNPDIIKDKIFLGKDRYNEFVNLNIINYFDETQLIHNFGFLSFDLNNIKIRKESRYNEIRLENDYFEDCYTYLEDLEKSNNILFINLSNLKNSFIKNNNNLKMDHNNLIILDTDLE